MKIAFENKPKLTVFALTTILLFLILTACSNIRADNSSSNPPSWQTITAQEAYVIMNESDNFILLDVRTESEFREARINGAILIPDYEIKDRAKTELPDKNAIILVYCRSGRRSASAAAELARLGYTNVFDFGGIINWPYGTVSNN
jgi:rhodanese-related sulfurtransferase